MRIRNLKKNVVAAVCLAGLSSFAFAGEANAAYFAAVPNVPEIAATTASTVMFTNFGFDYVQSYVNDEIDLQVQNVTPVAQVASFVQFDLNGSSLTNLNLDSARFNAFGYGQGILDLYYVANDSWVATPYNPTFAASFGSMIDSNNLIGSYDFGSTGDRTKSFVSFGINDLSFLQNDLDDANDGIFSVAMVARNFADYAKFSGVDTQVVPTLQASGTPAPAPEPSSLLLGLMGLSGLVSRRRKKD